LAVAHVLRARGNKGEVAAELLTDFPERLTKIREVYVGDAAAREPRRVGLRTFWIDRNHRGQGVFHFEGSTSISDAQKFRGEYIFLPFEQRVALPAGQYFVSDLIGCAVFETAAEQPQARPASPGWVARAPALLGTVCAVQFTGEDVSGTPLLAVDTARGELLVPLAEEICVRVDVAARRIEVVLPEGLRDVNEA
jgi:16S rRNA processing protein RimM